MSQRVRRLDSLGVARVREAVSQNTQPRTLPDEHELAAKLRAPGTRQQAIATLYAHGSGSFSWADGPLRDAVGALVREGGDALDELGHLVGGVYLPELGSALRENLRAPELADQLAAFDYLARWQDHRGEAIDWLERALTTGVFEGGRGSPRFGVRTLLESRDHTRVREIVVAYLVGGPARAQAWADLLQDVAPSMTTSELMTVVRRTAAALDEDASWASHAYRVWVHALPAVARATGMSALPWVAAALRTSGKVGLVALEALASAADIDRDEVLRVVLPLVHQEDIVRWPSLALHAAAALRPLAAGREAETIGVAPAIAKVWNEATLTVEDVRDAIVADHLAPSRPSLGPSGYDDRVFGSDLVIDVLCRASLATQFDVETGFVPVDYDDVLREHLAPLLGCLGSVVASAEVEQADGVTTYRISICAGDVGVEVTMDDDSDYYDVEALIDLGNALLEACASERRLLALETPDQMALVVCAPPDALRRFVKRYRLRIAR